MQSCSRDICPWRYFVASCFAARISMQTGSGKWRSSVGGFRDVNSMLTDPGSRPSSSSRTSRTPLSSGHSSRASTMTNVLVYLQSLARKSFETSFKLDALLLWYVFCTDLRLPRNRSFGGKLSPESCKKIRCTLRFSGLFIQVQASYPNISIVLGLCTYIVYHDRSITKSSLDFESSV